MVVSQKKFIESHFVVSVSSCWQYVLVRYWEAAYCAVHLNRLSDLLNYARFAFFAFSDCRKARHLAFCDSLHALSATRQVELRIEKDIEELSKLRESGAASVILRDLQRKRSEEQVLDPRSASRTPSASAEPPYRTRYESPIFACKSPAIRWSITKTSWDDLMKIVGKWPNAVANYQEHLRCLMCLYVYFCYVFACACGLNRARLPEIINVVVCLFVWTRRMIVISMSVCSHISKELRKMFRMCLPNSCGPCPRNDY